MYKKIIAEIIKAETIDDLDKISASIDRAFEAEKITWNDHEQLFDLIAKVSNGFYRRAGVEVITAEQNDWFKKHHVSNE